MNAERIQMRAILQTLPGLINALPAPEAHEAIILAVWPKVVGEQLREISTPIRLDSKTLFIAVLAREWKQEFEQHAGDMLYKLNSILRASVVARLEFVIDPVAVRNENARAEPPTSSEIPTNSVSKEITRSASEIKDSDLRRNFLKAAAACIERRDAAVK